MSLSSLPSIPKIENKFTEILTEPELSSIPTTSPSGFIPIMTATSFLKPKTESLHSPTTNLVEYYNQMFLTLDMYQNFINQKLHLWHSHLKLKYFDSMYQHQWATTKSIKRLRIQAQLLKKLIRYKNKNLPCDKKLLDIYLILTNLNLDDNFTIQLKYILKPLFLMLEKLFPGLHALNPVQFVLQIPIIPSNPIFFVVSNVTVLII